MLNHIVVMGRLTRDPELRTTQTGTPVVSFTVAVDRDFADRETGARQTDFIDIVAWRATAEHIQRNYSKGDMAIVMGRLQIRDWTDKEGQKRRNAEIVADTIYFGETRQAKEARINSYGSYSNRDSGYGQQGGYQSNYQSNYQGNQGGYAGNNSSSLYSGGNQGYAPSNNYGGYQSAPAQSAPYGSDYNAPPFQAASEPYQAPLAEEPPVAPKIPDTFQELDDPELPF